MAADHLQILPELPGRGVGAATELVDASVRESGIRHVDTGQIAEDQENGQPQRTGGPNHGS